MKKEIIYISLSVLLILAIISAIGTQVSEKIPVLVKNPSINDYLYWIYKVLIWISISASFLGLVFSGIKFLISAGEPSKLKEAREGLTAAIFGLLLIILTPTIIGFLFNDPNFEIKNIFKKPLKVSKITVSIENLSQEEGIYIKKANENEFHLTRFSIPKLPFIVDKVKTTDNYYAILFNQENYKGNCYVLGPNQQYNYNSYPLTIRSLAILKKSSQTEPSDITFFNKEYYQGGNIKINNFYQWLFLSDYKFTNIPESEKICVKWDEKGNCLKKESPSLQGSCIKIKNDGSCESWHAYDPSDGINSIEIKNASVLLVSYSFEPKKPEKDQVGGPFCQLFYDKGGTFSVPSLKNEYVRRYNRIPFVMQIIPSVPVE